MNYYDEIKNDIIEVLEDEHSREHEYLKENKVLWKVLGVYLNKLKK